MENEDPRESIRSAKAREPGFTTKNMSADEVELARQEEKLRRLRFTDIELVAKETTQVKRAAGTEALSRLAGP